MLHLDWIEENMVDLAAYVSLLLSRECLLKHILDVTLVLRELSAGEL